MRPVRPVGSIQPMARPKPQDLAPRPDRQKRPGTPSGTGENEARDIALLASVLKKAGWPAGSDPAAPSAIRSALESSAAEAPGPNRPKSAELVWSLPGFDRRCRVSTSFGELPIQALRVRDRVKTLSGAYKEVVKIDEIRLDADFMARHTEAHPLHLRAGALGKGTPQRNILVSPAQIICTTGLVGAQKTGPASGFEGHPSIHRSQQTEMTYYRFHCAEPETVCIEGAWFCITS
ncbi:Hint domain-containing protein [Sedimentitalea sp. HM32M-2]|uniref:Hint domain-containing protein n=1 Tax=Sedimentitalea sp. HM32M-2 TaxID=3351566 RepID=UPI0036D40BC5